MSILGLPGLGIPGDIDKVMNSPDDLSPSLWLDATESEVIEEAPPS